MCRPETYPKNNNNLKTCKGCWWEEGNRCYVNDPKRLPDGRSTVICISVCSNFLNKRQAMSQIIPNDKLIILSELKE